MSVELWLVCLAAAIGLSLTPGPNGLLALTHGARFGARAAVATVMGGATGFFLLIAVSLAGMGALLTASETAFTIAKWIGAAYLVYLGIRLWFAPAPTLRPLEGQRLEAGASPVRLFSEGFLVAVTNPKALIFFAAFLPQFMVPGMPFLAQLLLLGGTFVIVEIVYELGLVALAHRAAPWLARHGRLFNRITGATFVGIGAALATSQR
jgi:homoserine/homoserine lactone efflux protein